MQFYDGLKYVRVVTDKDMHGFPLSSVGICVPVNAEPSPLIPVSVMVLIFIRFTILATGNILCYLSRKIDNSLNESRDITIAFFNSLQLLLFGTPMLLVAGRNPPVYFLLQSMLNVMTNFVMLMMIFVPKIMIMASNGEFSTPTSDKNPVPSSAKSASSSHSSSNTRRGQQLSTSSTASSTSSAASPRVSVALEDDREENTTHVVNNPLRNVDTSGSGDDGDDAGSGEVELGGVGNAARSRLMKENLELKKELDALKKLHKAGKS
jgi:hypothetical protein